MADNSVNPKQIADPDNEGQMIDNPDYDPSKNEDGTPIESKEKKDPVDPKDDLAPIKENLNKAYKERDELKKEVADMKKALRDAEIERLKEEGKEKEAFEAQLSDRDAEIENLKSQIVTLTRDNQVRQTLTSYDFKNERAADLAYDSVVKALVQNEKGDWVTKSGKSIADYVKEYSEDEDNAFLFKQVESRGTDTKPAKPATPTTTGKKLSDLPQTEVLKMAAEGKLPNQR